MSTLEIKELKTRKDYEALCIKLSHTFLKSGAAKLELTVTDLPTIRFDLTGGRAGQALSSKNILWYNIDLAISDPVDMYSQTVPHEVSHLLSKMKYGTGIKPHGYQWQYVMVHCFNLSPKVCHNIEREVNTSARTYYNYTCKCGNHFQVTERKHLSILSGSPRHCKRCHTTIYLVEKLPGVSRLVRGLIG